MVDKKNAFYLLIFGICDLIGLCRFFLHSGDNTGFATCRFRSVLLHQRFPAIFPVR